MPKVTPFYSIRPTPQLAPHVAALPYDVYNRKEALAEIKKEPPLDINDNETVAKSSPDEAV